MSSDYGKELLRTGIIEARAGNRETARRYLDRAAYMSHDHEVLAEAWFWMSQMAGDAAESRRALENCLAHNLQHARARRALAILDGVLKADEIVDPDHLPLPPEGLRAADAQRFMCPKCGGRMSFSPDGQSLVCEYCSRNQKFTAQPGTAGEKDFIVAMATARGHGRPLNQQVFHCEGCGCEFILPPSQISAACVYCGSPHVVNWEAEEGLLAPDGIIPHAFDRTRAAHYLAAWVERKGITPGRTVEPPRGVYLPLWTFDLGGTIAYSGFEYEAGERRFGTALEDAGKRPVSDSYPVQVNDLPIPAARKLSGVFQRLIPTFELRAVRPYAPEYLADWPAEVYDIPMAEASLDARAQALARYKRDLPAALDPIQLTSTSSAGMTVESFRLTLLPVWMTEFPFDGREHLVLINGWNGEVRSDLPDRESGGLMDFLSDLLEA
jgi:tetratricopeptide (TPR) repeat protein